LRNAPSQPPILILFLAQKISLSFPKFHPLLPNPHGFVVFGTKRVFNKIVQNCSTKIITSTELEMTFFKNKSTATYFLWVEVLKMTEWEN
jgi:hypothetical protein